LNDDGPELFIRRVEEILSFAAPRRFFNKRPANRSHLTVLIYANLRRIDTFVGNISYGRIVCVKVHYS
jgi:hypothetical protein